MLYFVSKVRYLCLVNITTFPFCPQQDYHLWHNSVQNTSCL